MNFIEEGFVVEQIELRRGAALMKKDDALGPGRKMGAEHLSTATFCGEDLWLEKAPKSNCS